ncbi:MAG TPA: hypothetical protein PLH94_01880, partial [Fimbriimonadaceae bacterium]|nr:hypothetical protein [Fimbriimonadaceae bacterium]
MGPISVLARPEASADLASGARSRPRVRPEASVDAIPSHRHRSAGASLLTVGIGARCLRRRRLEASVDAIPS